MLLAPAASHGWYKLFFYWLHETAACCYFRVDLGYGLDHYSLSRLEDGTLYSSPDLLYFTLLLSFWLGQKLFKSNSSSLFSSDKNILSPTPISQKKFLDNSKFSLSRKFIPTSQKYSESHFLPDLKKIPLLCSPFACSCLRSLNGVP